MSEKPAGAGADARDRVFDSKMASVADFKFDAKVASVFDDMVDRSVPFYGEFQRMVAEMAGDVAEPGTVIYDLGCATGATLLAMDSTVDQEVEFVGVDDSDEMLAKCQKKIDQHPFSRKCRLVRADLNTGLDISNASVVVMVLTLQFVRPLHRERLVRSVLSGLNPGGCLLLVEKVLGEDSSINRLFIEYYYEMKRRHGYSEMEISQKREALENVLIPYKLTENLALLQHCGFRSWDTFFKWYNFCGIVAFK